MMQAFRSSAKVIAVVFAFLMLAFVLTTADFSTTPGSSRTLGRVNGERIDVQAYESVVRQAIEQRQRETPGTLGLEQVAQIRNEVWDQIVQNAALSAEYKRRGIKVGDDEVVDALRNSPPDYVRSAPIFQTDSQFDLAKYQRWLTSGAGGADVDAMAEDYRERLKRNKLMNAVVADIYLSDAALWERYRDDNEKVKIGLTAIVSRDAVPDSAVTVTSAEMAAYYKVHTDEFKRPKTAWMSYVTIPRLTNAADTAAARARAKALRDEIIGGAPFAEVARRESIDTVSGNRGGELGEWTRGALDPVFDSAAFSIPLNKISEPVPTQFGYHLIEVTKRKGNKATARHILVPIEVAGEHRDLLDAKADTLERLGAERQDRAALDTVARVLGVPIEKTGPVTEGSQVRVGSIAVPDAGVWAFEHEVGEVSPIVETPLAYYLFRLDSLQAAGVPPFAAVRPQVERAVRDQKKRAVARDIAKNYLTRVSAGTPAAKAAEALGLVYREFGPFPRVNPPLTSPAVVGTAFGLREGERSGTLDTESGLYVVELLDRVPADSAAFAKNMAEVRAAAVDQARQERVQNYLAALRSSAEVVDRRAEVLRPVPEAEAGTPPPRPL